MESPGWIDPFLLLGGVQRHAVAGTAGRVAASVERSVLGHIFRNAAGHVNPSSAASRRRYLRLFESVASNAANRSDVLARVPLAGLENGVQGFAQRFRNGDVWVHVRDGKIFNAGVNPFK